MLVLCGLNAGVILVSNWFVEKRGTAIGIALVGTSLGGAIFPQYGTAMIESLGWRGAYQSELVFPLVLLFLTIFVIRSEPADKNMLPYGGKAEHGVGGGDARDINAGHHKRFFSRLVGTGANHTDRDRNHWIDAGRE